ncbi:hypothetical protein [Streptomyces bauhiniae]|uniref:hypothetical protein n=1 Tax=Streptomyces bauhiniae TaxID=2340725 RepID=UPI0035E1E9BB
MSPPPSASAAPKKPYVIQAPAVINPGQSMTWGNGTLAMTTGGNLVVKDEKGTTRWATHTSGVDCQTALQGDGNFVLYDKEGNALWWSGTMGHPGAVLVLTPDGNVEIQADGTTLWQTGTGH